MPPFNICLNGEQREIRGENKLTDLLEQFGLPSQRVAIELNGQVVSRAHWHETPVNDGDRIEVVHFVGGG